MQLSCYFWFDQNNEEPQFLLKENNVGNVSEKNFFDCVFHI